MEAREAVHLTAGRLPGELSPELLCKFAKCFGTAASEAKVTSPIIVQSQHQRHPKLTQELCSLAFPKSSLQSESPARVLHVPLDAPVYPEHIWRQHSSETGKVEPFPRSVIVSSLSPTKSAGRLPQASLRQMPCKDMHLMSKSAPNFFMSKSAPHVDMSEPKRQCSRGGALSLRRNPNLEVMTSLGTPMQERLRSPLPEGLAFLGSPGADIAGKTLQTQRPNTSVKTLADIAGHSRPSTSVPEAPGSKWDKTALSDLFPSQEVLSSTLVPVDQIYVRSMAKAPASLGALRNARSNPTSPSSWRREDYLGTPNSGSSPTSPVTSKSAGHRCRPHFSFHYPPEGSTEYPGSFGALPHSPEPMFLDGAPLHSYPGSQIGSPLSSRAVSRDPSRAASRHLSRLASPDPSQPVSHEASRVASCSSSPRPGISSRRILLPDRPDSPPVAEGSMDLQDTSADSPSQAGRIKSAKRSVSASALLSPKEKSPPLLATQLCAKLNALRAAGNSCMKIDLDSVMGTLNPNSTSTSLTGELDKEKAFMGKSFSKKFLKSQEDKFGSLLEASLGNTHDTVESLTKGLRNMWMCKAEVCQSRHATACLADRALRAMEAKLQRLTDFRKRQTKYIECCQPNNRNRLLQEVVKGADPMEVAADAVGFRRFVAHSVHRCQFGVHDGKPQEADKTDFDKLMDTFGLPAGHIALISGKKALKDGAGGWASAALKQAKALAAEVLISDEEKEERKKKRIFMKSAARPGVAMERLNEQYLAVVRVHTLAKKVGALSGEEEDAVALAALEEELRTESIQLCADMLKDETDRIMAQDEEVAEDCVEQPYIGGAGALAGANKLQQIMNGALGKGVEGKHDNIRTARLKIVDLKAEAIRRDAKCMIFKSDEEYKKKGWIEDAATKCADSVEQMIQKATADGIPDNHPKLTAAYLASKELREQEGFRKREFHTAKRKLEMASKTK